MDITELLELEKQKEIAATEEKLRTKMQRQIRIFNKEKSAYTRRTLYEASKQWRSLNVLEIERDRELDNYLATKSEAVEKKYRSEEDVVRKLVKTTNEVKKLLDAEMDGTKSLNKEIIELDKTKWDHKKQLTKLDIMNAQLRFPNEVKMTRRIEWAEGKYHTQLNKNRALQIKIDSAIFLRDKFMKEEARLLQKLDSLNRSVTKIMHDTSEIYEQRDRAEGTKIKVREHLSKIKDQYERELLNISLAINDDKKMEHFMRTKHKDIIQTLQLKREKELQDATESLNKKDCYTEAFDAIKEATGKQDLNKIVQDFIEAEEDNFITFLTIGEILDENDHIRTDIRDLRQENVSMEERDIDVLQDADSKIRSIKTSVDSFKMKSEACQQRLDSQKKIIDEFTGHIQNIISLLKINRASLSDYIGKDNQLKEANLLGVMTVIEKKISEDMRDFCMVELSTRAVVRSKSKVTDDEKMITRIPSFHIGPHPPPKVTPINLVKEKEEVEEVKTAGLLNHDEARDVVVQAMMATKVASSVKSTDSRRTDASEIRSKFSKESDGGVK